jgi:transmembrane sensor
MNTRVGERRTLQLPDGSVAELNTDSRVRWSFDKARTIWLDRGEIALTIVQDATRPFLLHAGGVVGNLERGRYNVRLKQNGPQFISLAGIGTVRGATAAVARLEPLQAVDAVKDGLRADPMATFEVQDAVAWQSGEIIFRGMTLASAATEFNRYLERKIVVDPSAAAIRLGGRFQVNDLPAFLASLEGSFGVQVRASDRGYFISAG